MNPPTTITPPTPAELANRLNFSAALLATIAEAIRANFTYLAESPGKTEILAAANTLDRISSLNRRQATLLSQSLHKEQQRAAKGNGKAANQELPRA